MAKDSSVAPRERVNIVYRPADAEGAEEVELPLKMLVAGDFTGSPGELPIEKREPVNVNKENFDEVLKAHSLTLELAVPDRLTEGPDRELEVKLSLESLADFAPEAIVRQVPQMKRLLELREALKALKGPLSNVPEFRRKFQDLLAEGDSRRKLAAEIGWHGEGGSEQ